MKTVIKRVSNFENYNEAGEVISDEVFDPEELATKIIQDTETQGMRVLQVMSYHPTVKNDGTLYFVHVAMVLLVEDTNEE